MVANGRGATNNDDGTGPHGADARRGNARDHKAGNTGALSHEEVRRTRTGTRCSERHALAGSDGSDCAESRRTIRVACLGF